MRTILLLAVAAAIAAYPRTRPRVPIRRFATEEGRLFHALTADIRRAVTRA